MNVSLGNSHISLGGRKEQCKEKQLLAAEVLIVYLITSPLEQSQVFYPQAQTQDL